MASNDLPERPCMWELLVKDETPIFNHVNIIPEFTEVTGYGKIRKFITSKYPEMGYLELADGTVFEYSMGKVLHIAKLYNYKIQYQPATNEYHASCRLVKY